MEGLINSMTLEDPTERPLIEGVLTEFDEIRHALNQDQDKLRSRIKSRRSLKFFGVAQRLRTILHHTATPTQDSDT